MTRRFADHRSAGFSVIELIVTIGAIALISVGIAKIFQTVGETVSGGRRVSGFTQAAATLESQIRLDVQSMTRDGFMVIHHQRTATGILLAPGTPGPRPRRIDEWMFFARGDYATTRPTVLPDPDVPPRVATATEARFYYGHGASYAAATEGTRYQFPAPYDGDTRFPARAESMLGGVRGPNEYASDWNLLRQVTLLVDPINRPLMPDSAGGTPPNMVSLPPEYRDSEYQIAYQPAAGSIFKAFAQRGTNDLTQGDMPQVFYSSGSVQSKERPAFASGIVDIAATSLEEVRDTVMDVGGTLPSGTGANSGTDGHPRAIVGGNDSRPLADPLLMANAVDDDASEVLLNSGFQPWTSADAGDLPFMHAWMRDALPAYSSTLADDPQVGQRVRAEPLSPDLLETAFASSSDKAYFFADQVALTGSILLPRCTEFIVEWSFGEVLNSGQIVWHGGSSANNFAAYNGGLTGNPQVQHVTLYTKSDGTLGSHPVPTELIHDAESLLGANNNELYSYFGYSDPTYQPATPGVDPASIPWAWPKLIRITATFADALDPSIEESTQFIVEVPQQ